MYVQSKHTIFLFFLLILLRVNLVGQNEAKIWYFGNGLGFDFSSSPPLLLTNGSISTSVGCAVICSPTGALLFYTDGQTVWNQTHSVMANGTGLFGDPGAQNCVIVKKPQSTTLYYIFTVQGGGGSSGLCYSVVDMTLAAGNGSVISKNVPVYASACEEKISATKHCNQVDAWILVHTMNSNDLKSVLLTSAGISTVVTSSFTFGVGSTFPAYTHTGTSHNGSLKFSPNGRRVADVFTVTNPSISFSSGGVSLGIFETYDFDNSTGLLSNYYSPTGFTGPSNWWAYGTEFSPDGTKLYWTYGGGLMQMNHCIYPPNLNGGITQNGDQLSSTNWRACLQAGPDGKIYVTNPGTHFIGVIHNPNNPGSLCNYQPTAISLGTATCPFGLPNFYTPYFEKSGITFTTLSVPGQNCHTLSFYTPTTCILIPNSSSPYPVTGYSISAYSWNFGDPSTGTLNISNAATPTHSFSAPGTYTVKLLLSFYCGKTDTIIKTVNIQTTPLVSIVIPTLSCNTSSASVTSSLLLGSPLYTWLPSGSNTSEVTNLSSGTYTLLMLDTGSGCILTNTFTTQNITISNAISAPTICANIGVGSATANPTGGSGNYTYTWIGSSSTTSIATNLSPGNYSVLVTDTTNTCTILTPFQIIQSSPIVNTIGKSIYGVLCTGNSCSLSVSATGGSFPYNFTWAGYSQGGTINVLQNNPGTYVYTVVTLDANNCVATSTISLMYAPTPTLTVPNYTVCSGASISIVPSGAPLYYLVSTGSFTNSIVVNPTSTSIYTIIGQNSFCSSLVTSTITVKSSPSLLIQSSSPVCEGDSLVLSASGAQLYNWSGPNGFVSQVSMNTFYSITSSLSGNYTLLGVGSNSCTSSSSVQILVNPKPILQLVSNSPICVGQNLTLSASGASTYTWSGPNINSNLGQLQIPFVNLTYSGVYTLVAKSSASCTNTGTLSVTVHPFPTLSVSGNTQICQGASSTLQANGATTYSWSTGSLLATILATPTISSIYTLTGSNGPCASTTQFKISVSPCTGIYNFEKNKGIQVYPNPVSDNLFIQSDINLSCQVLNINSQLLFEEELEVGLKTIQVAHLPKGVYFLILSDSDGKIYKYKFIKV